MASTRIRAAKKRSRGALAAAGLALAALWLVGCVAVFHGVMDASLQLDTTAVALEGIPDRCTGLLKIFCERRRARLMAATVHAGMAHSWHGYTTFAWGADELHPTSKAAKENILGGVGVSGMGVTIVDALSTLHLMGYQKEFGSARDWVVEHLHFDRSARLSFFEVVIRVLGGLASAHDLSGDPALLSKALDLATRLAPAFESSPTGIVSGSASLPQFVDEGPYGSTSLAVLGTNILEFGTLALRSRNATLRQQAEKGLRTIHSVNPQAMLPASVDRNSGGASGGTYKVGAEVDSYYEYLLKYWLLGGKSDDHWRQRWVNATDQILEELIYYPPRQPFAYVGERQGDSRDAPIGTVLEHLACFWPGSVALGVMQGAVEGPKAQHYLRFAANMTRACFQLYNTTKSGLGSERIDFRQDGSVVNTESRYWQRPEVIESIFYMWRATHDQLYRDMGWQMWSAIEQHCRQEGGYSGVFDANTVPPESDDVTQSWWYAETLKYFWLLFSPDSALDLDSWVLNTEAHPLRALVSKQRRKHWWRRLLPGG